MQAKVLPHITQSLTCLWSSQAWPEPLDIALDNLGTALDVDRVRLWQVQQTSGYSHNWLSLLAAWPKSPLEASALALVSPLASFSHWLSRLQAGHSLQARVGELSTAEQQWFQELGIASVLVMPVNIGAGLGAILTLEYTQQEYYWPEETVNLLYHFTQPLGVALHYHQTKQLSYAPPAQPYDQRLVQLAQRKPLHHGNLELALQDISRTAAQTLEVERTGIWFYSTQRQQVRCIILYQSSQDQFSQGLELAAADYPDYFAALQEQRTIAAHQAELDPRTHEFAPHYLRPLGITSMLDAPIWVEGEMIGVVCHEHIGPPRQWTIGEQQFAAAIADLVSLAIESRDRHQALADLQASEERLQCFFQATTEAVVFHEHGRIVDLNQAAERMFGYSSQELIGTSVLDLADASSRELIRQRLQEPSDQLIEAVGRKKTGETFIGELQGRAIRYQGRAMRVVSLRDITQRKQAEIELRLADQREKLLGEIALRIRQSLELEDILSTTVLEVRQSLHVDRVFIAYLDGTAQQAQTVAAAISTEWQAGIEAIFQDPDYLQTLFSLGDCPQAWTCQTDHEPTAPVLARYHIQSTLAVPIPQTVNVRYPTQHLPPKVVLVLHQCAGPRDWKIFEWQLLEQLATQVAIALQQASLYQQLAALNANLEYQVQERTQQLEQKMLELAELNRLKDVFLHAVSHDLRTPVMGTLMVLNHLLPADETTAPVTVPRHIWSRMISSHNRQLTLIDSLLDIHTSEDNGLSLQQIPQALDQLIENTLADLVLLLDKNQTHLDNAVPTDLPLIWIDPGQLQRVFENLITNALKHNPPGLKLSLRARVVESEATSSQPMVLCTVQDNGLGIHPEQQEHLFDLYYQGKQSRHLRGIGLGLYLCRQIVQAHGGEIGVISTPDQGATFWLTLPIYQAAN
ncbi:GAF domain-containing protein [Synechococcus sp. PCC 6312]|uniref:GAF domain-containing protein n=1 Tax=Synechococcus sp. (strain ATCC 27167 / PCC 6312) TaxID=195253 RepID=UPI00029EF062|nr:GAF domain-containing protein [Synechococcus sp. PCC 6312]AFY62590.1 PAS domain S-box [Synechococcus sp. PCC 6312]